MKSFITKIYKCLCKLDIEGDDDGVSKPIPISNREGQSPRRSLIRTHKKDDRGALIHLKEDKDLKVENEGRQIFQDNQMVEGEEKSSKKESKGQGFDKSENRNLEKREETLILKLKYDDDEILEGISCGKRLLELPEISRSDLMNVFS